MISPCGLNAGTERNLETGAVAGKARTYGAAARL
jgi:hypothetical protein